MTYIQLQEQLISRTAKHRTIIKLPISMCCCWDHKVACERQL